MIANQHETMLPALERLVVDTPCEHIVITQVSEVVNGTGYYRRLVATPLWIRKC
jgi:hypothetical protein